MIGFIRFLGQDSAVVFSGDSYDAWASAVGLDYATRERYNAENGVEFVIRQTEGAILDVGDLM
jgi:hypothetical protein